MFITSTDQNESARPMATIHTDDDGTLWFFTHRASGKVHELNIDHVVHLIYAHPGKNTYMDVWGLANVVADREKIKELWKPVVKAWFPDGVDDPQLCLLKVKPKDAYYWDYETGKMVEFMKMMTAVVTGEPVADAVEGTLELH
jgi:general stress protein 26